VFPLAAVALAFVATLSAGMAGAGKMAPLDAATSAAGATSPAVASPGGGAPPAGHPAAALAFRKFVDTEFVAARKGGAPIVLYFEADWCEPCKEMHARTFVDPAVVAAAAGMELFRFDMTPADGYVDIMKNSFQVTGAPTVIVFAPGGKEAARRFGFIPPGDFIEMLAKGRVPASS
jgi:thiol:disulfide interchange protein